MRRWLRDFGFPILVLAALASSGYLAASVPVPDSVPDFALQAAPVYRLEVGAACFAAFYLAAMALMLAFDGRGFAEFGTKGLRVTEVIRAATEQEVVMNSVVETLKEQEERLERLEEER